MSNDLHLPTVSEPTIEDVARAKREGGAQAQGDAHEPRRPRRTAPPSFAELAASIPRRGGPARTPPGLEGDGPAYDPVAGVPRGAR